MRKVKAKKRDFRRCTGKCRRLLLVAERNWHKKHSSPDGFDTRCKRCKTAYRKENSKNRPSRAKKGVKVAKTKEQIHASRMKSLVKARKAMAEKRKAEKEFLADHGFPSVQPVKRVPAEPTGVQRSRATPSTSTGRRKTKSHAQVWDEAVKHTMNDMATAFSGRTHKTRALLQIARKPEIGPEETSVLLDLALEELDGV